MAYNDQMTPEEIQQTAQALKEAFDAGQISAEQFNEGMKDCSKGVRNYTANLSASLNQLGTATKQLGEQLLKGETGLAQYNNVVNSGGDALAKAAAGYGPAGAATAVLIKVLTFGFSQVSAMADGLYKANQDLSKAGAVGKEGMSGIFDNMQKFGYGVGELGEMTALISKNAQSLGQFGGSVIQGTNTLANMAKVVKTSDLQRQFMNMGMSVDNINNGIADYVSMQASFGIQSNESAEEQARAAAAYIKQQDLLTKMTGQSADQLQQNRAEAQQVEAWNAKLASMKPEEAAKYQAAFDGLRATSKTAAMGFAASITDMTGMTKESSEAFQMTGGAIGSLTKQFKENIAAGMDSNKAGAILKQGMADAAAGTVGLAGSIAKVGGSAGMGGFLEHNRMAAQAGGKVIDAFNRVVESQQGQIAGYDKATNEHTKLLQEQMATRDTAQSVVEKGIGPATSAFETLNKVLNTILHPFGGSTPAPPTGEKEAGGSGAAGGAMGAGDLKALGLNIKQGDVQQEGATISPKLIELAKKAQGIPGFKHFSSFNDRFHNENARTSQHTKGLALDFSLNSKPTKEEGEKIKSMLSGMGASLVIDEYNAPSAKATGGHFHAQVSAKDGAFLSGPMSGYQPNLTMHGDEAIIPMDKLKAMTSGKGGYSSSDITTAQANVPIISPFGEENTESEAPQQLSQFDKEMIDINDRIMAAFAAESRSQQRAMNTRV
jgi:hypothetical protein